MNFKKAKLNINIVYRYIFDYYVFNENNEMMQVSMITKRKQIKKSNSIILFLFCRKDCIIPTINYIQHNK